MNFYDFEAEDARCDMVKMDAYKCRKLHCKTPGQ
jgi:hypothetical protein